MFDEPTYRKLERRGEEIYDEMYSSGSSLGFLSEIKECFYGAIEAAREDGLDDEAKRLQARLAHIVETYRRYFTNAPASRSIKPLSKSDHPFDVLLDLKLSAVRRAASMLGLHFGELRTDESGVGNAGDFAFHIQCAWRFSSPSGILTGSRDLWDFAGPGERPDDWSFNDGFSLQDKVFSEFIGPYDSNTRSWYNPGRRLIVSETSLLPKGDVRIMMADESCELLVFVDACQRGGEAWRFFAPDSDDDHLVFPG